MCIRDSPPPPPPAGNPAARHDFQTGQGLTCKTVDKIHEALIRARQRASCGSYICVGSMIKSLR
eukprot:1034521-Pyramimonas_sp.AAC.1